MVCGWWLKAISCVVLALCKVWRSRPRGYLHIASGIPLKDSTRALKTMGMIFFKLLRTLLSFWNKVLLQLMCRVWSFTMSRTCKAAVGMTWSRPGGSSLGSGLQDLT
jgi:hypothetical protein